MSNQISHPYLGTGRNRIGATGGATPQGSAGSRGAAQGAHKPADNACRVKHKKPLRFYIN